MIGLTSRPCGGVFENNLWEDRNAPPPCALRGQRRVACPQPPNPSPIRRRTLALRVPGSTSRGARDAALSLVKKLIAEIAQCAPAAGEKLTRPPSKQKARNARGQFGASSNRNNLPPASRQFRGNKKPGIIKLGLGSTTSVSRAVRLTIVARYSLRLNRGSKEVSTSRMLGRDPEQKAPRDTGPGYPQKGNGSSAVKLEGQVR
jgi:hypothetical protein